MTTAVPMDPALPDLAVGDVYVREGTIVAVAQKIETPSAQVVNGSGMVCIPGFVDTHFHLWVEGQPYEAAHVHHAARQHGSGVPARDESAAVRSATTRRRADWPRGGRSRKSGSACGISVRT